MAEKEERETFEQLAARINRANLRFAVGNQSRGFSSTWTAFGYGDDYYIGSRVFMGDLKISLHASGICRVALTERKYVTLAEEGLAQPADRAMTKWMRPKTPETGAVHVASIFFPTDYLKLPKEPRGAPRKPLFIFDAAPLGQAVEFGFFYSREDQDAMEDRYRQMGQPVVCTTLEGGERVTVVARITDFDRAWLPVQAQLEKAPGSILSKDVLDVKDQLPNLTATFWNDPGDGGTFRLIEIGGVALKRNP